MTIQESETIESMRALEQRLTFAAAESEFAQRGVAFGREQMRSLGLIDSDGLYTNLALLLSDQCPQTTKVAIFQDEAQTIFKDRREFSGSLFQQMNDVYDFIDIHNRTQATYDKLLRIDRRDYPVIAVREALLNLLVHRDYAFSAASLINIYGDRMEMVSVGGLLPGIELEDISLGLSMCRNQRLANVFYRLHLIEAYGTGLRKIMQAYSDSTHKPQLETTKNAFKIILPNINADTPAPTQTATPTDAQKEILTYAQSHDTFQRADIAPLLAISASTASRLLKDMVDAGLLTRHGSGRTTYYTLHR